MNTLAVFIIAILVLISFSLIEYDQNDNFVINNFNSPPPTSTYSYIPHYNGNKAVEYGLMVHNDYFHKSYYPSGSNFSVMQKNLDYFNSEDCAHFVSEALIAGGLTYLADNPPGDNLDNYLSGFPGSYGIVGVYRLADWLAGYDLPIFPNNATIESIVGYQPIPASYLGSPHATVFYVTNYSMLPSYFLYPGDVVMDGGAGNGHAMLYIGNGKVVQTDPAAIWTYSPTVDQNITFDNMLSYYGLNVSAIYIHIPTFGPKSVRITVLEGNNNITSNISKLEPGKTVTLISSFPQGVGFGNYSYKWFINGKLFSTDQVSSFTVGNSNYNIQLQVTGTNGSVTSSIVINGGNSAVMLGSIGAVVIVAAVAIFLILKRKKNM